MNQQYITDILPKERQMISGRTFNSVWNYGCALERPRETKSLFRRLFNGWLIS